uniref:Uncharacterized protein n=1 Tax=Arundo donax TaxID=35708 RepID=A0A0A9MY68_ARUDO
MYVSPFKSNINCPKVPATKANALRQKFCKSLKSSMDIFIAAGPNLFNGFDIFDSFGDSKMLSGKFMATYISFIRHDEQAHMPDGGGYRVFLSQQLGEVLNIEEHEWDAEFSIQVAHDILKHDLLGIAPHKVKLFFLPVLHKDHWTVYCLNMIHTRIDVLDSSPADQRTYHEILADRIVPRLNELFQKVTNGGVKQFRRWKRPIIDLPKQFKDPDSGFLAIKNMVLWNGDALESQISPGRATVYRGEVLFFLMFHPLNEEKTLPGGLETFRPQP